MVSVEPWCCDRGQEELRTSSVWSSVGHGEQERLLVRQSEVLVVELLSVNGLSTRAISIGEVTALDHELGNDAVESAPLVVQLLAGLPNALLT